MKLPALWIALAFASGIAAARIVSSVSLCLIAAISFLAAGFCLALLTNRLSAAAALALAAWFAVGALSARLETLDMSKNAVARLISSGKIDTGEPLRWFGRLRDNPEATPLGWRYAVDLTGVEQLGKIVPVSGGLRLTYYRSAENDTPPDLQAGDAIETLCRARIPRDYLDPGAFDERGYLARRNIELLGSLRSTELLKLTALPPLSLKHRLARLRATLLARIDQLYSSKADTVAVLHAMLLGDRNFVNSDLAQSFQKTSAFHVLVLAGLHVAALAGFFILLGRIFRLPLPLTTVITLLALLAYVGVVQDRPPILRAALMAGIFLCARLFFRRVALVNTVALAALILLIARPSELFDSSYQLSFLAASVIAGLAVPWIDCTSSRYRRALEHLGDVSRDRLHNPRAAQFRLDLRALANAITAKLPRRTARYADALVAAPVRFGLRIWDLFVLSFCIQLGMLPLLAADFHRVSISGPISNIFAVLLTAIIVPLGFATLTISYISGWAAALLAKVEALLVAGLLTTVRWFSAMPRASWRIPTPPLWLLIGFLTAMVVLAALAWRRAEIQQETSQQKLPSRNSNAPAQRLAFTIVIVLAVLVAWYPFSPSLPRGELEATVLDVGQGDSIFVAFPDRRTMLIDGGGASGAEHIGGYQTGFDVGEQVVSPYLWSRGIKTLDVVVLTHAHHDHIDGLRAVLNNFTIGQLWVGRDEDSRAYRDLLAEAAARHIPVVHELQGMGFDWGAAHGQFFWPASADAAPAADNNDSVVLRIGLGRIHLLLPGDAEKQVEDTLTSEDIPLRSDFLKVPHHGSKTSSTENFLEAVRPRFAVISVGEDNTYGQPNPTTVQRYVALGVRLFRTDRDGAITVITDGQTLSSRAFGNGSPSGSRN